jgi:hypothetical protein
MQVGLTQKDSATQACQAIRVVRMGGDKIKEADINNLCRDFGELQFKPGSASWTLPST